MNTALCEHPYRGSVLTPRQATWHTSDGVPKHLHRNMTVQGEVSVSPFSSEKEIHWRGTPPHVRGGSRPRGPSSIGLLHSPCVSLDTLERGP